MSLVGTSSVDDEPFPNGAVEVLQRSWYFQEARVLPISKYHLVWGSHSSPGGRSPQELRYNLFAVLCGPRVVIHIKSISNIKI